MIVRVAFFILMSLGLIGFGTVAWITTRPMGLSGPTATKMILVTAQPIQGGSLLTSDDLQQKEIPVEEMTKEYNLDSDRKPPRLDGCDGQAQPRGGRSAAQR